MKAATGHEGAGGKNGGNVVMPERTVQLFRHLPAGGAEAGAAGSVVLDVKDIAAIPCEKQVQRLLCCSQPVKDPPWQMGRQLLLQQPEKGEAIPKGRLPFCGQHEGSALRFLQ